MSQKHKKLEDGQEGVGVKELEATRDSLIAIKIDREKRAGLAGPVVPEDGTSRLHQMMKEYARNNGGLWPYFNK